ncbi:CpaD family pilus assembly lipoprotein [Kiloniella sp.]|uniref:CpaD family pilus assembly lipoprotein n=1 Tax=Kiloniella sp. TaxID=1938587 RepID=UPI003B0225B2
MSRLITGPKSLWMTVLAIPFLAGCTEQQGFMVQDPIDQTVQAGRNLLNTGSWRPLPTTPRTQTFNYIASEGFQIPSGYVETDKLNIELKEFINAYNITATDIILLDGLRNNIGRPTTESQNAINRLRFALNEIGYQAQESVRPIAILDPSQHNAAILIHRKIIVAPDCDIKPHPVGTRPTRRTFGCVQEVNLANMVVSPEALDGSGTMSSADSTAVTLGIDRYRRGEITPLDASGVASGSDE